MSERRTSVAKDVLEQKLDNALDRYGELTSNFEQAQESDQPLETSLETEKPFTRTSVAREVVEQNIDNLLERYGETSIEFNNAHENFQENKEQGRSSSMVSEDKMSLELKPDQPISKDVTRASFNDRWLQEQQDANQENKNDEQDLEL